MGWVSESSYLYVWGNGGGITQKPSTTAPEPQPDAPVTDDGKDE